MDEKTSHAPQVNDHPNNRPHRPFSVPDLIVWEADLEFNFTYVSESSKDMLGYSASEWLNTPDFWVNTIIHPEDQHWVRQYCVQETISKRSHECVHRAIKANGEMIWVKDKAYLSYDDAGRSVGLYGFMMDVTKEKTVEERLRQVETRYRIATRVTRDVIWDWNLLDNQISWNEGVSTIFSFPAEQMSSDIYDWYDNIHPDDRERIVNTIHSTIAAGNKDWEAEYRYRTGEGTYMHVVDRGVVIHDERNMPVRMIGAMTDISARKRLEQEKSALLQAEKVFREAAEHALRERDQLVELISHDLKNPLSNILMNLALTERLTTHDAAANTQWKKAFTRIHDSAEKMKTLVEDLVLLVKSESRQLNLEPAPIEADELISRAVDNTKAIMTSKKIGVDFERASTHCPVVLVDNRTAKLAVDRLLRGAARYATENGRITMGSRRLGGDALFTIEIPVTDKTLSERQLENFFSRRGSIIDLSIAQNIIELNGGRIWTEQPKPDLLVINFTMPIAPAKSLQAA